MVSSPTRGMTREPVQERSRVAVACVRECHQLGRERLVADVRGERFKGALDRGDAARGECREAREGDEFGFHVLSLTCARARVITSRYGRIKVAQAHAVRNWRKKQKRREA